MNHTLFAAANLAAALLLATPAPAQQGSVPAVRQADPTATQPRTTRPACTPDPCRRKDSDPATNQPRTTRPAHRTTQPEAIERMTELPSRQPPPPGAWRPPDSSEDTEPKRPR